MHDDSRAAKKGGGAFASCAFLLRVYLTSFTVLLLLLTTNYFLLFTTLLLHYFTTLLLQYFTTFTPQRVRVYDHTDWKSCKI